MRKYIEKIRLNTWLSVMFAILLGVLVLFLSKYFANILKLEFGKITELNFYTTNVIFKFLMLSISIIIILFINKWSLKEYGFRKSKKIKIGRFFLISTGIIIASFIVGNVIFNGVLRSLFPVESTEMGFPKSRSIIETILTVWIWSSICEEVLTRGLIQGFLNYQKKLRFLKLSLPVWISGLFFGAMHLSLLKMNMDIKQE